MPTAHVCIRCTLMPTIAADLDSSLLSGFGAGACYLLVTPCSVVDVSRPFSHLRLLHRVSTDSLHIGHVGAQYSRQRPSLKHHPAALYLPAICLVVSGRDAGSDPCGVSYPVCTRRARLGKDSILRGKYLLRYKAMPNTCHHHARRR